MLCVKCKKEIADGSVFCNWCGKKQEVPERSPRRRGNGEGTAIKRGKTWTGVSPGYSYVDDYGKTHRVRRWKGGFATRKEALAWVLSGQPNHDEAPKLIELWQGYSENDMLKLSESKQSAYRIARNRLESIISRRIDTLSVCDLQEVINRECKSYYPAHDVKTVLSKLYQRAMASNANKGRITQNLSEFIVLPELQEKEAEPFIKEEVDAFWKSYENGDKFAGYILLLCYTGMMPGELFKCKKDMVDLENCEIRGAGAKTKERKKSSIVFPEFLKPIVEDLLTIECKNSNSKNDKLLSMNKDNFYKSYYEALERAGVRKLTPYSCRHTYGTEAVKLGMHPEIIKKMLRHSNTKMQERYTHLSSTDIHHAANMMQHCDSKTQGE